MIYNPKTRRQFLVGTGGALLAIPFLPSLMPKAFAVGAAPLRFICLGQDNGRFANDWYPNVMESAKLRPVAGVENMRDMLMRDIAGDISPIFGSAFNGAIRDKLTIIRGLDGLWRNLQGHQTSTILAGNLGAGGNADWEKKNGPSVDYILAKNIKSNPRAADLKSYLNLRLRSGWDMSFRYNSATNVMASADRYTSPSNAFDFIFGGGAPAGAMPSDRNKKVVDLVLENYKSVIGSRKIAKAERDVLQEHIDTLNQLQSSIIQTTPVACVGPAGMGGAADNDIGNIDRAIKQHMDLMIAAVKCGIVNIGTIMLSDAVDDSIFSNLTANGAALNGNWHGTYTHTTMDSPEIRAITQRFAGHFAYMINQLNVPEPGTAGTFLDNSLVYWGNAMGHGTSHGYNDMAVAMAGGLAGRIRTGRFIDYSNTAGQGRNYCAFLVALLQSFGLNQADYQQPNVAEGFGSDTLYGYGETGGNYEPWRAERKSPVPGLLA